MSETTFIEEAGVHVCNNCGAHASSPEKIKHFATCQIGEAKKWEKIYTETAAKEPTLDLMFN
jgi:hypothetical protein